ncbi:hypothetical protein HY041_00085 [Candidatus Roizmanbacteria bacterium]|nr:hypothetical protein [Candidatus Roizmanbacteria bacterium]
MVVKKYIIIFVLFLFFAIGITYPLILHLSSYSLGKGDELLITWIINWNIHALSTNPLKIFAANIFYPYLNTLSFSEPFFTSSIIALIPTLILKNPLVAYNINIVFSLTLLGFSTYCLTYYLSKNILSAFIAGLLISFSPFTLGRLFQIQVISIQWIPLSLIFFIKFLREGKTKNFIFASVFFMLQVANSFLPGYFLILCYSVITVSYFLSKKNLLKKFFNRKIVFIIVLTSIITGILGYPYFKTSKTFHYVRDIRDTIHFANRPEYFFYPNDKTRLETTLKKIIYVNDKGPYRYDGYWGLPFLILFILSCLILLKMKRQKKFFSALFLAITALSFVMSLGPAFQWGGKVIKYPFIIPLPYALFYYLIPGFNGLRNSGRWEMLTIFAASVFIGLVLAKLMKKMSLKNIFITCMITTAIFAEIRIPFKYYQLPTTQEFPKVYSFINSLPNDVAIIELPIFSWDVQPYSNTEFMREYFSTLHFRKMVNGYSGFSPKEWEKNTKILTNEFPSKKTIEYLKRIKVNYVILHKKDYDDLPNFSFEKIKKNIETFPELKFTQQFENDYIYKIE